MTEIKLKVYEDGLTQVWIGDIMYVSISECDAVKADLARVGRENNEFALFNKNLTRENAELKTQLSKLQEIDTKLGGFTKHWNNYDWSTYTHLLKQVDDLRENYGKLADKYNDKVKENAELKSQAKDWPVEFVFRTCTDQQLDNYATILLSRLITRLKQKEEIK